MRLFHQTTSGLFGLVLIAFLIGGIAHAASQRPEADIVYSARYYRPGKQPSHYNIWRINRDGSGRVRVTSGSSDDFSPIWLADGKTILFIRQRANTRTICTVNELGGRVEELATLPVRYAFIDSIAPNRRSLVYLVVDSGFKLILFDVVTREQRILGDGTASAWSPDSRRLFITARGGKSEESPYILDMETGRRVELPGDFRKAVWIDNSTLVAEEFVPVGSSQNTHLIVLRADDGTREREVALPFNWDDESDEFSPFADKLSAVPGHRDHILYGRHAGSSTQGSIQMFYRVSLKGGEVTALLKGRDLAWSPGGQSFLTGDGRDLAPLGKKRHVWVSPLSVFAIADRETRPIVKGLVSVCGFDWRLKKDPIE